MSIDGNYFFKKVKNGAWFDVKNSGVRARIGVIAGCFLNFF